MNRFICSVNEGNYLGRIQIDFEGDEENFLEELNRKVWFKDGSNNNVNPAAIVYVNPPYEVRT